MYNGYWVFPEGKERPGRDADPSPLLMPWSRKSTTIALLPLWAVRPVQSLSVCTRVYLTLPYKKMVFDYSKDCLLHFSKGLQLRWQSTCGESVNSGAHKRCYPHRPHMATQNFERSTNTHHLRVTECDRFLFSAIIDPNNRCQLLR